MDLPLTMRNALLGTERWLGVHECPSAAKFGKCSYQAAKVY